MSSMNLTNVLTKDSDQLKKLKDALDGQSWMDFSVTCYPIGGSFNIDVTTRAIVTQSEMSSMVTSLMADYILGQ